MDMNHQGPVDEWRSEIHLAGNVAVMDWFVMDGGAPGPESPAHPEVDAIELRGIQYFVGFSTFVGDGTRDGTEFAVEVGAIVYEFPPFDRESLMSMVGDVVAELGHDPETKFLEFGEEGLWVFRRLRHEDILDHHALDSALSDLVGLAESLHAAVH